MKGLELVLAPQEGVVLFTIEPADAELSSMEPLWEKVPAELKLPAVEHAIEIRKEGHDPFRTRTLPGGVAPAGKGDSQAPRCGSGCRRRAGLIRAKNGYEMKRWARALSAWVLPA